ncbi:hypothetical protein OAA06_02395 [bacterium]|nr:hypothetical protein [bacterium]
MQSHLFVSESKFLERARLALTSAATHEIIKAALIEYGCTEETLTSGDGILANAVSTKEQTKIETSEIKNAGNQYKDTYSKVQALFKRHRDLGQIFFKKKPNILITIGGTGPFPTVYNEFFSAVKHFYTSIKNSAEIQAEFDRIKITSVEVDKVLGLLDQLLAERQQYDTEMGEAQDATALKNVALLELKNFMDEFDTIAKVALYDRPQLLEVLGIFVRN